MTNRGSDSSTAQAQRLLQLHSGPLASLQVPERHVVFSAKDRIRTSRSGAFHSIAAKLRADEEVDSVALAADASTGSGSDAGAVHSVHSSIAKRRDTIVEFNGDMSLESLSSSSASSSVSGAAAATTTPASSSSSSYSLERKLLASGALLLAASAPNARGMLTLSPSNPDTADRQIHAPPSPLPDDADADTDADDGSANPHRSIDARHVNLLRPVSVCVALTTEQVAEARQRAKSLKLGESTSSSSLQVASLPRGLQLLVCDRHRLTRVTIDSAFSESSIRCFMSKSMVLFIAHISLTVTITRISKT